MGSLQSVTEVTARPQLRSVACGGAVGCPQADAGLSQVPGGRGERVAGKGGAIHQPLTRPAQFAGADGITGDSARPGAGAVGSGVRWKAGGSLCGWEEAATQGLGGAACGRPVRSGPSAPRGCVPGPRAQPSGSRPPAAPRGWHGARTGGSGPRRAPALEGAREGSASLLQPRARV